MFRGGNWKEEILEYISPDQLPQAYGGNRCEPDPICSDLVSYNVPGCEGSIAQLTLQASFFFSLPPTHTLPTTSPHLTPPYSQPPHLTTSPYADQCWWSYTTGVLPDKSQKGGDGACGGIAKDFSQGGVPSGTSRNSD